MNTTLKTRLTAAAAAIVTSLSLLVATLAPAMLAEPPAADATLARAAAARTGA